MAGRRAKTSAGPYLLDLELVRDPKISWEQYPYNLPAVRGLSTLAFHPKVTFFVGENGAGKSTLLEAIAIHYGLNPEGGSRHFRFQTRGSHSALHESFRLAKSIRKPADSYFLRAESFFNVATEIERLDQDPGIGDPLINAYGGRSLHEQSHGESFLALVKNRFREHGLYVMDEPEAALSPRRQLEFLAMLHNLCKGGAQFLIATHSPIIMAYPDAWIYVLDGEGPRLVPYGETDHYLITRGFLANPKRTLDLLMADDESDSLLP